MKHINFLIKPASSLCNLRCKYCFYEDEASNRAQKSMGLMSRETADLLLTRAFAESETGGTVSFTFQGGEPTMAGLDFYRRFASKARELCPPKVKISFSIQTNGTLLDEDWARFLHDERFLVGISLDGFKDLHDLHRADPQGRGSWSAAVKGLELLKKQVADVNALCVVTGRCARSPGKVYSELKKLGFDYIQLIACLDPIGEERGSLPWSLTPDAYGKFLRALFDLWYADWEKGQYRSIRLFEDYVHILLGDGSSTCATCGTCGAYFTVEGDGSVYPCDFFVLDQWKMGNLRDMSLKELGESEAARRFLQWGREKPAECAQCQWGKLCNGGCKNDWVQTPEGNRNYYCESFKTLLDHAYPRLLNMARAEYAASQRRRP